MPAAPHHPIVVWLMQGDPSVRFQITQDPADQALIAQQGWGKALLDHAGPDSHWVGLYTPKWTSATYTLLLLRQLGLAADNPVARAGSAHLLDRGLFTDNGINFWPRLRKQSETCVTGMVLSIAARFLPGDPRLDLLTRHLLAVQMPDGGWNCQRPYGAVHSSMHTTISALEGLLEYESAGGGLARQSRQARERAHVFLLEHQLFRSHLSCRIMHPDMTKFSFPPHWHYDVLRGLDYLRAAGTPHDVRLAPAIDLLRKRRTADGRWLLPALYRGRYYFTLETPGQPSRWNTMRALRVLDWLDLS